MSEIEWNPVPRRDGEPRTFEANIVYAGRPAIAKIIVDVVQFKGGESPGVVRWRIGPDKSAPGHVGPWPPWPGPNGVERTVDAAKAIIDKVIRVAEVILGDEGTKPETPEAKRRSSAPPAPGLIVGIAGRAGSGKDTAGEVFTAKGFQRVAFADPIKRFAREIFDFSIEQCWGPSEMRNKPDERYPRKVGEAEGGVPVYEHLTPRHALQLIGTEIGRACYADVWVDYGMRVAKRLIEGGCWYTAEGGLDYEHDLGDIGGPRGVVFTDVRFPNEARRIRALGGKVVLIERPGVGLSGAAGAHESERPLDREDTDARIVNGGTLEEFRDLVGVFADDLLNPDTGIRVEKIRASTFYAEGVTADALVWTRERGIVRRVTVLEWIHTAPLMAILGGELVAVRSVDYAEGHACARIIFARKRTTREFVLRGDGRFESQECVLDEQVLRHIPIDDDSGWDSKFHIARLPEKYA